MKLFGKLRYRSRQERNEDQADAYRLGFNCGTLTFHACKPRREPEWGDSPVRNAYEMGVQHGYASAEKEYEDEVGWFLREEAERGMLEIGVYLAQHTGGEG